MEGNEYTSHMSDCPYRNTFGAPRRTLRDRGTKLISDVRWEFSRVDWGVMIFVAIVMLVAIVAIFVLLKEGGH